MIYQKSLKAFLQAPLQLYALRSLKAAGLNQKDLVLVYCSLVRSVVENASPVWAALPIYLQDMLEAVQKKLYLAKWNIKKPWKPLASSPCVPEGMMHA